MRLKQFGFSLMETTVALGIAGVAGYLIMQQTETSGKIKSRGQVDETISHISKIIQTHLSHRPTCSESLRGLGPGDEVPALVEATLDPVDYNNFIPTGKQILKDVPLITGIHSSPIIKTMEIITEGGNNFLKVTFDPDPLQQKKLVGAPNIIKRFQIQGNMVASKYVNCNSESSNLIDSATTEACTSLGGTQDPVTKKCTLDVSNLVDSTPAYCPAGAKIYPKTTSDGKLAMGCIPCPPVNVWDHYDCGKPFSGMNWVNMCYYKSVCQWDSTIIFSGAVWDGRVGPTSASGGDTGTQSNCHSRRRKCAGEP